MDVTVVVGVIAAAAAVLSAVVSAQRVPAQIRELEKLALAAGAIDASPETRRLLDLAIREAIPEPRIRSIWPEVLRVAAFAAGGTSLGLAVLATYRGFSGLRWESVLADLLVAVAFLVMMPLLVVAREALIKALSAKQERERAWREGIVTPVDDADTPGDANSQKPTN